MNEKETAERLLYEKLSEEFIRLGVSSDMFSKLEKLYNIASLSKAAWKMHMVEAEVNEKLDLAITVIGKHTCYVNPITAPHRHGNEIQKRHLDRLSNYQIYAEKALKEIKGE